MTARAKVLHAFSAKELESELNDFLSKQKLSLDKVKLSYSTIRADRERHDDALYVHFVVLMYE